MPPVIRDARIRVSGRTLDLYFTNPVLLFSNPAFVNTLSIYAEYGILTANYKAGAGTPTITMDLDREVYQSESFTVVFESSSISDGESGDLIPDMSYFGTHNDSAQWKPSNACGGETKQDLNNTHFNRIDPARRQFNWRRIG